MQTPTDPKVHRTRAAPAAHLEPGPAAPAAPHGPGTEPWAELSSAHAEPAAAASEFDLDDSRLWQRVDSLVACIAGTAYTLTETLTGEPGRRPARGVPAVARVREQATAQRRLFAALDRYPPPGRGVIDRATDQVRALNRELRCAAAQSPTASASEPKSLSGAAASRSSWSPVRVTTPPRR